MDPAMLYSLALLGFAVVVSIVALVGGFHLANKDRSTTDNKRKRKRNTPV